MKRILLLSALALLASACTDPDAPDKCVDFRDAYCAKQDEYCAWITDELCTEVFDELVDCDEAIDIEEDYGLCMEEIDVLDHCPENLPAECRGVIVFPEEEEEDPPADSGFPDWLIPEGGNGGGPPPGGFDAGSGGPPPGFDGGVPAG